MNKILAYLPHARKAFVAAAMGFLVSISAQYGFDPTSEQVSVLDAFLSALFTGFATWAIPNKPEVNHFLRTSAKN